MNHKAIISFLVASLMILSFHQVIAQEGKEERDVGDFSLVDVGGAFKVYLKPGPKSKVTVDADSEYLDQIRTEVRGDELRIYSKGNLRSYRTITVYVEYQELEGIRISGAADVVARNTIKSDDFSISVSGAGNAIINLEVDRLDSRISGAGDIILEGSAGRQEVKVSGAGSYRAFDLDSDFLSIKLTGAGNADVTVRKEIEAYASGAGSIKYSGNPEKVKVESTGAGSIRKR